MHVPEYPIHVRDLHRLIQRVPGPETPSADLCIMHINQKRVQEFSDTLLSGPSRKPITHKGQRLYQTRRAPPPTTATPESSARGAQRAE